MLNAVTHIGAYQVGEKQSGVADGGSCSIDPRQLTGFLKVAPYGRPSAFTDVCGQGHGCNRHSEIVRVGPLTPKVADQSLVFATTEVNVVHHDKRDLG